MTARTDKLSFEYDVHVALHEVATAPNPLKALNAFRNRQDLLQDWRVIYADEGDRGPFKLRRHQLSERGFVSTAFRGKSIWILDRESVNSGSTVKFLMGTGTYVDSNAASYIRSLAYRNEPPAPLLQIGQTLTDTFAVDELARLNPYLYLWEAQRHWTPETVSSCRQAVAALHALSLDATPLDEKWGTRFRKSYRERAEAFADALLVDFQAQLDNGLGDGIAQQVDALEAMIVRTKIIEATSQKSAQHKLEELVRFMHDDLSIVMLRELIVCADIICRSGRSALSQKLNSLHDRPDPLAVVKNCAWDLYLPRAMDSLTNTSIEQSADFYIANMLTFDRDVTDIVMLTELRAIAMHRTSTMTFPFFNEEFTEWLEARVGNKRLPGLKGIFQEEAFGTREQRRSINNVRDVLAEDRAHLLELLKQKGRNR